MRTTAKSPPLRCFNKQPHLATPAFDERRAGWYVTAIFVEVAAAGRGRRRPGAAGQLTPGASLDALPRRPSRRPCVGASPPRYLRCAEPAHAGSTTRHRASRRNVGPRGGPTRVGRRPTRPTRYSNAARFRETNERSWAGGSPRSLPRKGAMSSSSQPRTPSPHSLKGGAYRSLAS